MSLRCAAFDIRPEDDLFEDMKTEFLTNYATNIAVRSTLFAGVADMLSDLERRQVRWGIVTNKASRFTDQLVPKIGLAHAGCIVSGDTTPYPKPHPAPLLEAAARLGSPAAQCWYVGDDLRDIEAGRAADMATIAAAWGYCGISTPESWAADIVLEQPIALIDLLDSCVNN